MPDRVLVIGLDGFDITHQAHDIARGDLPALRDLHDSSARFLLEHSRGTRTGLAWEHFASGRTPESTRRSAAVEFDPARYTTTQVGGRLEPFFAELGCRTLVFDAPYASLERAPRASGVVAWGAHDPGVPPMSSPSSLVDELDDRFGAYPSARWTYATPWPSPTDTAAMGRGLVEGLASRTKVARALLDEHDWELAIVVSGELHTAAEGLWHGVDPHHPLAGHPSAEAAGTAFAAVASAADRMVAELLACAGADVVIVFSMCGMGINASDVPSMVLLPELVYRWSTGGSKLEAPPEWRATPAQPPIIPPDSSWDAAVAACFPPTTSVIGRRAKQLVPLSLRRHLRRLIDGRATSGGADQSVEWIPGSRYRRNWPTMRAFALPSYYDGRLRVNLRDREANGIVGGSDYAAVCDELEELVRACRDPRTGESPVADVERLDDPMDAAGSDGDLVVVWRDSPWAFEHPEHGVIGPVPYRRTGGHTGPHGFAYVSGPGIEPGARGVRSAFDVVPTIVELTGHAPRPGLAGTSLLSDAPPGASAS